MSLLRSLHPQRELEPYEILSSFGGYPTVIETPTVLPDHSAMELRLRKENSARRQREKRLKDKALARVDRRGESVGFGTAGEHGR